MHMCIVWCAHGDYIIIFLCWWLDVKLWVQVFCFFFVVLLYNARNFSLNHHIPPLCISVLVFIYFILVSICYVHHQEAPSSLLPLVLFGCTSVWWCSACVMCNNIVVIFSFHVGDWLFVGRSSSCWWSLVGRFKVFVFSFHCAFLQCK